MIAALGLIAGVLVIGFGAPRYLSVTVAPGLHARLGLIAWTASIVVMLAAMIAAPVSMIMRPGRTTFGAAHACLQHLRDDGTLPWVDATQVALTVVLAAMVAYLCFTVARHLRAHHRAALRHVRRLEPLAVDRGTHQGLPVLWVEADEPVCLSVAGPSPVIIASTHIAALPARQRVSVLDHEAAHLRGRHHTLVAVAEALAAAMPVVPLLRDAPDAARTLVEFAADEHAAQSTSPATVGSALLAVQGAAPRAAAPRGALAMSGEAVTARLHWLGAAPRQRRSSTDYPLAIALAAVPVVVSVIVMLGAAALVCLQMRS